MLALSGMPINLYRSLQYLIFVTRLCLFGMLVQLILWLSLRQIQPDPSLHALAKGRKKHDTLQAARTYHKISQQ